MNSFTDRATELLNTVIDAYKQRYADKGYVRLHMGLLKDPSNPALGPVDGPAGAALMSHFRIAAKAANFPGDSRFAKSAEIIAFVKKAFPGIHMDPSEVRYTTFPAGVRTREVFNELTGELETVTRMVPASTVPHFGELPGRKLSPEAEATNAMLNEVYSSLKTETPQATEDDLNIPA
jgi:hypothetical protein